VAREVSRTVDGTQSANDALRQAIQELHKSEEKAWERYAADLEQATVRFDSALDVAATRLRAEKAETSRELEDALEQMSASLRARADQMRVQGHLAEMEARDVASRTLDELDGLGRRVTATLGSLRGDAGQSFESLKGAVHRALDEIGGAIGDVRHALKE
jgi:small-conductance mechanosensitive channel